MNTSLKTPQNILACKTDSALLGASVTLSGWIRSVRDQKKFGFVTLNDGSCLSGIQVVVGDAFPDIGAMLAQLSVGACIRVTGLLRESLGKGQSVEVEAESMEIIGACDPGSYPLQKKKHSFEFLRTIAHLRPRTNTIGAITRIRSTMSLATHNFFAQRGFHFIHTPTITASDCEGAGEMFQVTTLDMDHMPRTPEGTIDYTKDFFGQKAFLTVSGQLEGECYALGLSKIYTFGPAFRAENSNTSRHLAEFWMIEPEVAFANLEDDQNLAEDFLKEVIKASLEKNGEDLEFFQHHFEQGLLEKLEHVVHTPFERVSYTEAIRILERAAQSFIYPVKWGLDLQSEHERYLSESYFKKPVIVTDYPKDIKSFYMRQNDDGLTVAAMDVLVPGIGEIIGGSQREERYDLLKERMFEKNLPEKDYWWYLDLRKFGGCPHAGFGVGFERLVRYATGVDNIREVIPFPRTPGNCAF